jgi:hypothetical protein
MNNLKVKNWISTGNISGKAPKTQDAIMDKCGGLLDESDSHEILGDVIFQATDGKYYTVNVVPVISKCDASFAKSFGRWARE